MNPEDLGIPLICPEAGPEFWARVRAAKSRRDLRDVIAPVIALLETRQLNEIAAQKIFDILKKFALRPLPMKIPETPYGSSFDDTAIFCWPIPDDVLFAAIDETIGFNPPRGFWRRILDDPSFSWCRDKLDLMLHYFAEHLSKETLSLVFGHINHEIDGEDPSLELIHFMLREVAEFVDPVGTLRRA
jgi:hypothetical protein